MLTNSHFLLKLTNITNLTCSNIASTHIAVAQLESLIKPSRQGRVCWLDSSAGPGRVTNLPYLFEKPLLGSPTEPKQYSY